METVEGYYLQTLIALTYEIKTKDVCKNFSSDKQMLDFSNYSTK